METFVKGTAREKRSMQFIRTLNSTTRFHRVHKLEIWLSNYSPNLALLDLGMVMYRIETAVVNLVIDEESFSSIYSFLIAGFDLVEIVFFRRAKEGGMKYPNSQFPFSRFGSSLQSLDPKNLDFICENEWWSVCETLHVAVFH